MPAALPDPGPSFVIPPGGRLFAVFDAVADAGAALDALVEQGLTTVEAVWAYAREADAARLDPRRVTGAARLLQLLLSADVEYRAGLAETVQGGGAVLAIGVARSAVAPLLPVLRAQGGRTFAYRRSINFVPVA